MVRLLAESPLTIALSGGLIAAILFVIWLQASHRLVLIAFCVVVAATAGLVGLERLWVTDREQLNQTLYDLADTVGQKSLDELLTYIHPDAAAVRQTATSEYNHYQLDEVRITQVWETEITDPEHAVVKFNVIVVGGTRSGDIAGQRVARYVIVWFQKHQGAWKVAGYSHHGPQEALRREDASGKGAF